MLNVTGWIHYLLPGVFQDHPMDRFNIQLWTVPLELDCYILLVIFAMLRLHRSATASVAASTAPCGPTPSGPDVTESGEMTSGSVASDMGPDSSHPHRQRDQRRATSNGTITSGAVMEPCRPTSS